MKVHLPVNKTKSVFKSQVIEVVIVPCPGCNSDNYEIVTTTMDYDYMTTDMVFRIVRCSDCGLIYLNPRPKLSEISKIYPSTYSAYQFSDIRNTVIRRARNFMQAKKAHRILLCIHGSQETVRIVDVGCGSPILLNLIRGVRPQGIELYGNDFNPDTLRLMKEAGFKTMEGKFEEVDWELDFFDVVIMNQVIEHLFDIPGILRKAYQLLKPNGVLFIETPSEEGIDAQLFRKNDWGGYHTPRHLLIFNSKNIAETLQRYGFFVEAVEYVSSPNFWTSSFRNFLFRHGFPYSLTRRMNYRNVFCMALFTFIDLLTKPFYPTSNMRVIARKSI